MIKPKLLFAAIAVLFTFFIVIVTAFRISQPVPQEGNFEIDNSKALTQFLEATSSSQKGFSDYQLPYPGILPNHPFYWAKMIRDKAKLTFTKNKIDLFQLYLLYADKRLISGLVLVREGQNELAVTTLTKAEKYLFKAANLLVDEIDEQDNPYLYHQISKSYIKHKKEIKSYFEKFTDKQKEVLEDSLNNNQAFFENHFSSYIDIIKPSTKDSSPSALISE